MKSTLKVRLIIDDKTELRPEAGGSKYQETTWDTLKALIASGNFKAEFIPPWLDNGEPIMIITEL